MFGQQSHLLSSVLFAVILCSLAPRPLPAIDGEPLTPLTEEQYLLETSRLANAKKPLEDEAKELGKRAREIRPRLLASELKAFRAKKQHPANVAANLELESQAIAIQEEFVSAIKAYSAKSKESRALEEQIQKLREAWEAEHPKPRVTASRLADLERELLEKSKVMPTDRDARRAAMEKYISYENALRLQNDRDLAMNRRWIQQATNPHYFWEIFGFDVSLVLPTATPAQVALIENLHRKYRDEHRIALSKEEPSFVALARLHVRLDEELSRVLTEAERNELLDYRLVRFFHPGIMLEPAVEKRLGASAEQIKQIRELCETWPKDVRKFSHATAFNDLLTSDQTIYLARLLARQTALRKARNEAQWEKEQAARPPQWRTWKSAVGQFSVEADLLSFEHDIVSLKKKETGQIIHIPRLKLSTQDRNFLHERYVKRELDRGLPLPDGEFPLSVWLTELFDSNHIVYDLDGLRESGIDPNKTIAIRNKQATFSEALMVLSALGLKITATEGRIYIEPAR